MKICIIGLGYVGLPLSIAFSKANEVVGFDRSRQRIAELRQNIDETGEVSAHELRQANINFVDELRFGDDHPDYYIVCVPTPVNDGKVPDLTLLQNACSLIGKQLKHQQIVIFESTVYPGATEEICIPILEKLSGLTCNSDFGVGYSPERINPGKNGRKLGQIKKVVSGSSVKISTKVVGLYSEIVEAGVHEAQSIKVAEAAKVIENVQRDVNIALVNHLSEIFDKLDVDVNQVLEAARTKWNFLDFRPGFVGGHCIGVDPYYLSFKAKSHGVPSDFIETVRRINDAYPVQIAQRVAKLLIKNGWARSNILVAGFSFKENCPDTRNTKIFDLVKELQEYDFNISIYDPVIDIDRTSSSYFNLEFVGKIGDLGEVKFASVIVAVAHDEFITEGLSDFKKVITEGGLIVDLKNIYNDDKLVTSIV